MQLPCSLSVLTLVSCIQLHDPLLTVMATRQALYYAAWFGDLKEVRKLVSEHCHDVMARDSDGHTPLHIAAWSGRDEAVRELITTFKCPVNCVSSDGRTPLHLAAK